jgi:hypothetical protein
VKTKKVFQIALLGAASGLCFAATPASSATITNGFTFSVADGCGAKVGTHFHSSTGGDFGNPAGKGEVGSYFCEEVRGLSEYNLAGLTSSGPAFVTFEVFNKSGLFGFPEKGDLTIDIYSYLANNAEDISDFEAPPTGFIGSFNTSGLSIDDTLSFDVDALLDAAIIDGNSSFGIRLQPRDFLSDMPTWTFDNFRLTTDDQSSGVAVPGPLPLLGVGAAFGYSRKLRKRIKTKKSPEVLSAIS